MKFTPWVLLDMLVATAPIHQGNKQKKIYYMLYIEHIDENDVAERFGFKADAAKRKKPRYKQIANLKKKFYNIAIKIIKDHDIL